LIRRFEQIGIRPTFLFALTLVGMAIVVASSLGQNIQWIGTGRSFGLLQVLPMAYWVGIGIMMLSMALAYRSESEGLFFSQALLMFVAIWGAPALFEKFPSVWDSYRHYYSALDIARTGVVSSDPTFAYSFNYPGYFVVTASFTTLGDPNAILFLKYYPVFAATFTLAAIYLFVRTYVPGLDYKYAFLAAAFVNVWLQFSFSPQSAGLAAGLLIFVCLEREGLEWRLAAIALFTFVVVAHPTTLLFVLGAIVLKESVGRTYRYVVSKKRPLRVDKPWPLAAFILIWIGWLFTGASSFSTNLAEFLSQRLQYFFRIGDSVQNQIHMRGSENILGTISPQIRIAAVGVFVLMALASFLIYLYLRHKTSPAFPKNILALFIIPFIIIPLDTVFFNGQLYDRGILFLMLIAPLIFVPLFIGRAHRYIRPVLAVGVGLLVILSVSTVFYQETMYMVSDQSIDATNFLTGHMPPNSHVIGDYYPFDVWSGSPEQFERLSFNTVWPIPLDNMTLFYGSGAVVFDRTSVLWYKQWGVYDMYEFYVNQSSTHYKVFDNGAYQVIYSAGVVR
jgi:hypothetical protein